MSNLSENELNEAVIEVLGMSYRKLNREKLVQRILKIQADKVNQYSSFCGCPMCEHHTSAYSLSPQSVEQE